MYNKLITIHLMKFMKYIIPTLHLLSTLYCSRYFFRITIFIISEILLILKVKIICFGLRSVF